MATRLAMLPKLPHIYDIKNRKLSTGDNDHEREKKDDMTPEQRLRHKRMMRELALAAEQAEAQRRRAMSKKKEKGDPNARWQIKAVVGDVWVDLEHYARDRLEISFALGKQHCRIMFKGREQIVDLIRMVQEDAISAHKRVLRRKVYTQLDVEMEAALRGEDPSDSIQVNMAKPLSVFWEVMIGSYRRYPNEISRRLEAAVKARRNQLIFHCNGPRQVWFDDSEGEMGGEEVNLRTGQKRKVRRIGGVGFTPMMITSSYTLRPFKEEVRDAVLDVLQRYTHGHFTSLQETAHACALEGEVGTLRKILRMKGHITVGVKVNVTQDKQQQEHFRKLAVEALALRRKGRAQYRKQMEKMRKDGSIMSTTAEDLETPEQREARLDREEAALVDREDLELAMAERTAGCLPALVVYSCGDGSYHVRYISNFVYEKGVTKDRMEIIVDPLAKAKQLQEERSAELRLAQRNKATQRKLRAQAAVCHDDDQDKVEAAKHKNTATMQKSKEEEAALKEQANEAAKGVGYLPPNVKSVTLDMNGCFEGRPMLHAAAYAATNLITEGFGDVIRELVNAGSEIDSLDKHGSTALYVAAHKGHSLVLGVMLEIKASPDVTERPDGYRPLDIAAINGHRDIVRMLLQAKSDADRKNPQHGDTALFYAARAGQIWCVEELLDGGADPDLANDRRVTPAYIAFFSNHNDVTELLLRRGANSAGVPLLGPPSAPATRRLSHLPYEGGVPITSGRLHLEPSPGSDDGAASASPRDAIAADAAAAAGDPTSPLASPPTLTPGVSSRRPTTAALRDAVARRRAGRRRRPRTFGLRGAGVVRFERGDDGRVVKAHVPPPTNQSAMALLSPPKSRHRPPTRGDIIPMRRTVQGSSFQTLSMLRPQTTGGIGIGIAVGREAAAGAASSVPGRRLVQMMRGL